MFLRDWGRQRPVSKPGNWRDLRRSPPRSWQVYPALPALNTLDVRALLVDLDGDGAPSCP